MKNILLISCSQRKRQDTELMTAIERYDGPVYRSLRKLIRDDLYPRDLSCLIISAKYGLITAQEYIANYDQRMTPERAVELRNDVHARLSRHVTSDVQQIFINLGKDYMHLLEGFHWGTHLTMEASGGIGQRVSQMKHWIRKVTDANTC